MASSQNTSEQSASDKKRTKNRSAATAKGSGSDVNSDQRRLSNEENLQDKMVEDSFPASDAPSQTPVSGSGRTRGEIPTALPEDFKENKAAQFEYGRQSQASTQHFDTSTNRLRNGNPDVGDIDLGTIEANKPAQPDDDDHFDSAEDDVKGSSARSSRSNDKSDAMLNQAERKADINRQNEY